MHSHKYDLSPQRKKDDRKHNFLHSHGYNMTLHTDNAKEGFYKMMR